MARPFALWRMALRDHTRHVPPHLHACTWLATTPAPRRRRQVEGRVYTGAVPLVRPAGLVDQELCVVPAGMPRWERGATPAVSASRGHVGCKRPPRCWDEAGVRRRIAACRSGSCAGGEAVVRTEREDYAVGKQPVQRAPLDRGTEHIRQTTLEEPVHGMSLGAVDL
eukprot:scaffold5590_cov120-Isochrysis_galbana.AAC.2